MVLRLALVLNPLAGLGGPAGLKGSDGEQIIKQALARGSVSNVAKRVEITLRALESVKNNVELTTVTGKMGSDVCSALGWSARVVEIDLPTDSEDQPGSTAEHTRQAVRQMQQLGIDLLVFAGGDGTARDVFDVADKDQAVLGIPCGVKMHSGVFANSPASAAKIIQQMARGQLVTVMQGEVRDIDEGFFREGVVRTRYYGELLVPEELRYMQQVKDGGREVEALVVEDIAAEIMEQMHPNVTYFIGSGSTTASIMNQLGLENTLLGVDVIRDKKSLLSDAHERQLFEYSRQGDCCIVVSVIGGQGHVLGRGNQQLSPRVLRNVGLKNLIVIASKSKLEGLHNQLKVDTGDLELDQALSGYIKVITGYEDAVLCPVDS
ncbi:MAG: ATP-NAD kinase family protein [bacterium]|nr:ATP-NAD kinase [Gammaproteobacteria bacterium]HIL96047.1 ATP-NAD kinase [Pseudomonadales bacterium]